MWSCTKIQSNIEVLDANKAHATTRLVCKINFYWSERGRATLHTAGEGGRGEVGNVSRDQEREEQQRMLATNLNLY